MPRKYAALLTGLFIAVAVAVWWRVDTRRESVRTAPHSDEARVAPKADKPKQASAAAGHASTSAAPASSVAPTKLWSAPLSTEGAALDNNTIAQARQHGQRAVGRTATFAANTLSLAGLQQGQQLIIPLPGGRELPGVVNLVQAGANGTMHIAGGLTGTGGSFSVAQAGDGKLAGRVILREEGLAYVLTTSAASGRTLMREVALADILCGPYQRDSLRREPQAAPRPPQPQAIVPLLQSRPGASAVLYLDFDGETVTDPDWNDGETITADPSDLSSAEIIEVWNRVKEDYAPFNINVTTVPGDYTAAPINSRMRVIITPTDDWYPDAGGVAYTDSFAGKTLYEFDANVPAWVFNRTVDGIAEAISHEAGHTFGLSHDGRTSPVEEYYAGHGSGATSWAPIMGVGYDRNVVQWSKGEYPNANNTEDDVAIISGNQPTPWSVYVESPLYNSTGYIADDAGNTRLAATAVDLSSGSANIAGLISSAADDDFYSFTLSSTKAVTLNAVPANTYPKQPNLDIRLELQDSTGTVLTSADPANALPATLEYAAPAGTYYIRIRGTGRTGNGTTDPGYSNYGSIGQYTLVCSTATAVPPSITDQASSSAPVGEYSSFFVTASGSPLLLYQWQRLPSGTGTWANLNDGTGYSGTQTTSLHVAGLSSMDGDQFRCVVTNGAGSATSNPMTLTIFGAANALAWVDINMPSGGATGSQASGTVTVINAGTQAWGPNHQMVLYGPGSQPVASAFLNGVAPGQIVTVTINFTVPVTPGLSYAYTLQAAQNGVGNFGGIRSFSFSTFGGETAPVIVTQPLSQAVNAGDNIILSVVAIGKTPLSYQWKFNGADISGATSASLALNNIQTGSAGNYRVVVTNVLGTATSDVAVVSIGIPPGVVAAAGGDENTVFVRANGTRWGTGFTGGGELGANVYSFSQPTQIDTGIAQATSRGEVGAYVKLDGTLWLMGHNIDGFVQGGQVYQTSPLAMTGATNVAAMAIGSGVSYVRTDGTLWTAGINTSGQLGDGTVTTRYTPAQVAQDVAAVAAGAFHAIFLKADGTVWGCGYNTAGQLGSGIYNDGQPNANTTPYLLAQGVAAIDARGNYNLLLKTDGSLWLLGAPPWQFSTTMNAQIATNVVQMSAGGTHVLFVRTDGTLWAMGKNDYGQLGDGTLVDRTVPVQIATDVFEAAGGRQHSLFIKNDGSLWGMGKSFSYQLGNNPGNGKLSTPVQLATGAVSLPSVPASVSASDGTVAGAVRISWSHAAGASGYEIWRGNSNASGAAAKVGTVHGRSLFYDTTALAGTVYYYWVKALNPFGVSGFSPADTGSSASATLPVISVQPASVSYPRGTIPAPIFSVTASGNPLPTYRWQQKPAGESTWYDISTGSSIFSGTLTPQLSVINTWDGFDGVQLRCVVTNSAGSVASNPATWTFVNGPNAPIITSHPVSVTASAGATVTFSAAAAGPASYQWQRKTASSSTWADIGSLEIFTPGGGAPVSPYSGQDSGTLTITGVTAEMNGDQFRLKASNSDGPVFSNAATLTVNAGGSSATPYTFTTFAGHASSLGSNDGTGSSAQFYNPAGVAVDSSGNVYVADSSNATIRKITPGGAVTTLAGSAGNPGSADGTGSVARFSNPRGVAVDGAGNVYVADSGNHTIRKITPGGVVTTLAGSAGNPGSADDTGSSARFSSPRSVAVDDSGNVYVADYNNHTIRKITSAGIVTTLAGLAGMSGSADGTGLAARFLNPTGVAVDASGTVYVGDGGSNHMIRKITAGGVVTTLAGSAGNSGGGSVDGTGSGAKFNSPLGVAVDSSGTVYVADASSNKIRKVTAGGVVTTLAGSAGNPGSADGAGSAARFNSPLGVAVDISGNLYVADFYNHSVRKVTAGGVVTTLAGVGSVGSADGTGSTASFFGPYGMAVDGAGNAYVTDGYNNTVRKITAGGVVTTLAGLAGNFGSADGTGSAARFNFPAGVGVDGAGTVYVADYANHTIRKITAGGVVTTLAGSAGSSGSADGTGSVARFNYPRGVAVDSAGNVYVADTSNCVIRKITAGGVVTTLAGLAGNFGSADGTGSVARFDAPIGVAVDSAGNVYVTDFFNCTIRKITAGGVVTTLAGSAENGGSTDGAGSTARFYRPIGVAVDGLGNVYAADTGNDTIRKITPGGVVTTLAGSVGNSGSADGTGSAARFYGPAGVAVDGSGNVYVADYNNNTIRKGVVEVGAAPTITLQPVSQPVSVGGSATFTVTASGTPSPAYQWQRQAAGGGGWSNVSNGGAYSGATSASLTISGTTMTMNGDQFRCVATNSAGSTTSNAATLTISPNAISYDSATYTANAAPGGMASFTCNVTNVGAQAWGADHWLEFKAEDNTYATYRSLNGVAVSGSRAVSLSFAAPVTPGTYTYRLRALDNASGYFGTQPTLTLTVSVPGGAAKEPSALETGVDSFPAMDFERWRELKFTTVEMADLSKSGPEAIYSGDGLPNLIKYALGLEPKDFVVTGLPETSRTESGLIIFSYTRPSGRRDIIYTVQVSTDLINWTADQVVDELVEKADGQETWQAYCEDETIADLVYFRLVVMER